MHFFLIGLLALALFLLFAKRLVKADIVKLAKLSRTLLGGGALGLAALLTLTGRIVLAIPLAILGASLLGRAFALPGFGAASGTKTAGQKSEVYTTYLHMVLDHDSGEMSGTILKGRWRGQSLDNLTYSRLIDFWRDCAQRDTQSEQLMSAYLDRVHPNWRDDLKSSDNKHEASQNSSSAVMTVADAYNVLGLSRDATPEDIQQRHRALMKQFHPDQGGSTYLATKINEAKDILLKNL